MVPYDLCVNMPNSEFRSIYNGSRIVSYKCESISRHFQPGEVPSRGHLRDCDCRLGNFNLSKVSFPSLIDTVTRVHAGAGW